MSADTHTPLETTSAGNGQSTAHDLFALTDEQILEIAPEGEVNVAPPIRAASSPSSVRATLGSSVPAIPGAASGGASPAPTNSSVVGAQHAAPQSSAAPANQSSVTSRDSSEPPAWLAAQMKDPWSGEEARELWNGVLQARQEAAAYRATFATPEDAKALKELYPGGINEARTAAERARALEDIDRAYFGVSGGTPEQASATRAELAQRMLREDPTAFREMVFAGLRALEEAEKASTGNSNASALPRLAQVFAANRGESSVAPPFRAASSPAPVGATPLSRADARDGSTIPASAGAVGRASPAATNSSVVGARHAVPAYDNTPEPEAHLAAYAAFEKAANDDLERSVGVAISRTIEQALPNLKHSNEGTNAGARSTVPLRERLAASVRHDVESALKGDSQLGEQIAQILSARRFDNETRAQVVRLIDDRARQLVPVAAKRVINDWTQTTLAAHRTSAARSDAASARREVEPASAPQSLSHAAETRPSTDPNRGASRPDSRRIDYRKLSDEQILDL